jgi:hypothetical protein
MKKTILLLLVALLATDAYSQSTLSRHVYSYGYIYWSSGNNSGSSLQLIGSTGLNGEMSGKSTIQFGMLYPDGDIEVGVNDIQSAPNTLQISNYPNPCSTSTNLEFTLEDPMIQVAGLSIYNSIGSKVLSLDLKNLVNGKNTLTLNTQSLESGSYKCVITANDVSLEGKFVVIK